MHSILYTEPSPVSHTLRSSHSQVAYMEDNRPGAIEQAALVQAIQRQGEEEKYNLPNQPSMKMLTTEPPISTNAVIQAKFWELTDAQKNKYIWHNEDPDPQLYKKVKGEEKWGIDIPIIRSLFSHKYPVYRKKELSTKKSPSSISSSVKPPLKSSVPSGSSSSKTVPIPKTSVLPTGTKLGYSTSSSTSMPTKKFPSSTSSSAKPPLKSSVPSGSSSKTTSAPQGISKTSTQPESKIEATSKKTPEPKPMLPDNEIQAVMTEAQTLNISIKKLTDKFGITHTIPNKEKLHSLWKTSHKTKAKEKTHSASSSSSSSSSSSTPSTPPLSGFDPEESKQYLFELYQAIGGGGEEGQLSTVCSTITDREAGGHFTNAAGEKFRMWHKSHGNPEKGTSVTAWTIEQDGKIRVIGVGYHINKSNKYWAIFPNTNKDKRKKYKPQVDVIEKKSTS